jgi:hypothetical protein
LLQNIINSLGAMPASVTPSQTGAYNTLTNESNWVPQFGPQANKTTSNLFGYNTQPIQNLESTAFGNLSGTLSPYLSSSYLNPMSTPGLSTTLQGLTNSISNNINDQFAAAGRDLSPGNTTALAYGLEQGEAPILTNQYNANVGAQQNAANALFGAGNTTAGALTQEQLAQLGINTGGLTAATSLPGVYTAPGTAQFETANAGAQLPFQNMGWLSSLAYPLGALGGQSTASGTTTLQTNPLSNILGGLLGGMGLIGGTGGFGSSGWLNPSSSNWIFSDENLKEGIKPIGMLYDGQPVYEYRYVKELDPSGTPRIGLLAQDVENVRPDAVADVGGFKAVDYSKATENSKYLGMLAELDMAA